MEADKASQTIPVQITRVFMLCCTTQSLAVLCPYNFDCCKSLNTLSILKGGGHGKFILSLLCKY